MTIHTFGEAMADLDMEQSDAVEAFARGEAVGAIARQLRREENSIRAILADAFFWMSRALKGQPASRRRYEDRER